MGTATLTHDTAGRVTAWTIGDRAGTAPEPDGLAGVARTAVLLLCMGYTVTVRRAA